MVVYTAARLQNLPEEDAAKVAQFIRIAVTEGQRPGSGNGELPDGYLPIEKAGVTAKLYESALEVADAVEAQQEPKPADGGNGNGGPGDIDGMPPPTVPTDGDPSTAPSPSAAPTAPPAATPMPATLPVGSELAGGLLPLLILLGAIGCVVATALRVVVPALRRRR